MAEGKRTREELQQLQALPLEVKITKTKQRLKEWIDEFGVDGVYVSFSGGKDSTVLLHIVRQMYPDVVKAVFVNTGLEFPEIVKFIKTFNNVDVIKPKTSYVEVIKKYGYPIISKEVSECVSGARKYLTQLLAENDILVTDRQTDSILRLSTDIDLKDYVDTVSSLRLTGGGVREQVLQTQRNRQIWQQSQSQHRNSDESIRTGRTPAYRFEWEKLHGIFRSRDLQIWMAVQKCQKTGVGGGGEIKQFSNLTGIRTTKNTIDARLYKDYRQFANPKVDGDQQDRRESNDGDYP